MYKIQISLSESALQSELNYSGIISSCKISNLFLLILICCKYKCYAFVFTSLCVCEKYIYCNFKSYISSVRSDDINGENLTIFCTNIHANCIPSTFSETYVMTVENILLFNGFIVQCVLQISLRNSYM